VHFDVVDHSTDAFDGGHGFLGDLLLIEAGEPARQEEDALPALARDPS
jgi:hypothetical protein